MKLKDKYLFLSFLSFTVKIKIAYVSVVFYWIIFIPIKCHFLFQLYLIYLMNNQRKYITKLYNTEQRKYYILFHK